MSIGLLGVERFIIESLGEERKSFAEIQTDTDLEKNILKKILNGLVEKEIVSELDHKFAINFKNRSAWCSSIVKGQNVKMEAEEILQTLTDEFFRQKDVIDEPKAKNIELRLKKIFLTEGEELIFRSFLYNIESYLKRIEEEHRLKKKKRHPFKTAHKKVIFWGYSNYSEIINNMVTQN